MKRVALPGWEEGGHAKVHKRHHPDAFSNMPLPAYSSYEPETGCVVYDRIPGVNSKEKHIQSVRERKMETTLAARAKRRELKQRGDPLHYTVKDMSLRGKGSNIIRNRKKMSRSNKKRQWL